MSLRVIDDDSEPLNPEALRKRGNELLREVRAAALDAMRESADPIYFADSYKVYNVLSMQRQAAAAASAWRKVDGLLSELQSEIEKTRRQQL